MSGKPAIKENDAFPPAPPMPGERYVPGIGTATGETLFS
jgi:hypothetical protein